MDFLRCHTDAVIRTIGLQDFALSLCPTRQLMAGGGSAGAIRSIVIRINLLSRMWRFRASLQTLVLRLDSEPHNGSDVAHVRVLDLKLYYGNARIILRLCTSMRYPFDVGVVVFVLQRAHFSIN